MSFWTKNQQIIISNNREGPKYADIVQPGSQYHGPSCITGTFHPRLVYHCPGSDFMLALRPPFLHVIRLGVFIDSRMKLLAGLDQVYMQVLWTANEAAADVTAKVILYNLHTCRTCMTDDLQLCNHNFIDFSHGYYINVDLFISYYYIIWRC